MLEGVRVEVTIAELWRIWMSICSGWRMSVKFQMVKRQLFEEHKVVSNCGPEGIRARDDERNNQRGDIQFW